MVTLVLLEQWLRTREGRLAQPDTLSFERRLATLVARRRRALHDRRTLLAMDERWLDDIGLTRGEVLRVRADR